MKTINLLAFCILLFIGMAKGETPRDNQMMKIDLQTKDNIKISTVIKYPQKENGSSPALVFIHQGGSSKEEWMELPIWNNFSNKGFVVVAFDLRLHGESGKDQGDLMDLFTNPTRAPLDLLAVMDYLFKDPRINKDKIGIIGASVGGNLACVALANPKKFHAKTGVSFSPKTLAVQKLNGEGSEVALENIFYIASKADEGGAREKWAGELYQMTSNNREIKILPGKKHGSFILKENPILENELEQWLVKTL